MPFEHITFDISDGVATITLNRPERLNALSPAMVVEMLSALDLAVGSDDARVFLIRGEGRGFSSGADLSTDGVEIDPDAFDAGEFLEKYYNPLMQRLFQLPLPIVSAVHGPVVGAGCMIALAADFVIAADTAYFLQAFINVGLVPDAGSTWWLPRLVGTSRALSMMMLGERVGAEQAALWGMIHQVVGEGEETACARALAERLAKGPTLAYSMTRRAVREGLAQTFEQALLKERANQQVAGNSADFLEGVDAFREKRKPQFTGK